MEGCGNGKVVMGSIPVRSNSFTVKFAPKPAGDHLETVLNLASGVVNQSSLSGVLPSGVLNTVKAISIRINSLYITKGPEVSGLSLILSEIQPDGSLLQVGQKVNLEVLNTMCANQTDKITVNDTSIVVQKNQILQVSYTNTADTIPSTSKGVQISGNLTQQF